MAGTHGRGQRVHRRRVTRRGRGKAVTQLKKISNEAHREMKQDHAKSATAPKKTDETPPPPAPGTKRFEGEGKSMNRGGAAQ